ncbi:nuclear transport factor 2 family protein [Archangium violaceum]|uniref:nuclear transport factor 2 family protein n=1 Tax=Archangium violaceum TaxID=83451 RepID=UPI00193AF877|nr:nuclear transport factor 2 family protein [Archangium violaceum]QRK08844.1 nuclear transport factor 2 family protein [Archangium violaceum]
MVEQPDSNSRLRAVQDYFRKVDLRDPGIMELFTDDVQLFFPKFGVSRGKAGLARFSQLLTSYLESIEHDIEGFRYVVSGDSIVVEGTERGVTRDGVHWPDNEISQGRFCNVFEFEGPLIRRVHIYVDPDFTSADLERVRLLRGGPAEHADTRTIASTYFERLRAGAEPDALASLFSEDVDWDIPGDTRRVPWIGKRKGRAGVAGFFRELREQVESLRFEVRSLVVEGNEAVAPGHLESRVKSTGRIIDSEFALHLTVRNGLIVRYRLFEDSHAVARATGP